MKKLNLIILVFLSISMIGQNLIKNPGFEYGTIPTNPLATNNFQQHVDNWTLGCTSTNGASPDIFDVNYVGCELSIPQNKWSSNRPVRVNGTKRYVGFSGVEPILGELKEPLSNCEYEIDFYAVQVINANVCTNPNSIALKTTKIEVILRKSGTPYCTSGLSVFTSSDINSTNSWQHKTGTFTLNPTQAQNGYDLIEFKLTSGSNIVYLDDVSLKKITADLNISGNLVSCGESILSATAGFDNYLWSTGETSQSINANSSGAYTVSAWNNSYEDCKSSDSVNFIMYPIPDLNLPEEVIVCNGEPTPTINANTGFVSYVWGWPNTMVSNGPSITPSMSGQYCLTAITADNCEVTECFNVIYSDPIMVTLNDQDICLGETTTLCPLVPIGEHYSFLWNTGETTRCIDVSPSVNTTYSVLVTNSDGCSETFTSTVNVLQLPIVDAGSNQTVCEGNCASLIGSATGASPFNYSWSNGVNTANTTVCPTLFSQYTLTVTDDNGCSNSDNVQVDVLRNVQANFSIAKYRKCIPQGLQTQVCFTNLSIPNPNTTPTYYWDFGNGQTSNLENPCISFGSGTYTITLTYDDGVCNSSTVSKTITIHENPSVVATMDQTICEEDSSLPLNVSTNASNPSYNWSPSQSLSCSSCTNPIASPSETTKYIVTVTDQLTGCSASDIVKINVIAKPSLGDDFTVCPGEQTTITATVPFGNNINDYTFSWYRKINFMGNIMLVPVFGAGNTPQITITANSSSMTYVLNSSHPFGCSWSDEITITSTSPQLSLNDSRTSICGPRIITATVNAGTPPYTYSLNGNTPQSSNVFNVYPTSQTTYTINVVDANGCSDNQSITLAKRPFFGNFRMAYQSTQDLSNGPFVIRDNSSYLVSSEAYNATSYHLWIVNKWGQVIYDSPHYSAPSINGFNDEDIYWDGRTSSGLKVSDGTYWFFLELWNCNNYKEYAGMPFTITGNSKKRLVNPGEKINKVAKLNDINALTGEVDIYPNPTSGKFNVELPDNNETINVEVLNLMGEVIYREQSNSNKLTFDLSNHSKGVYLVKITTNGETKVEKVIFQ